VALSDSIFRTKLRPEEPSDESSFQEIPVRNTFIQFAAQPDGDAYGQKHLSTAPAWVGPSLESAMMAATESAVQVLEEGDLSFCPNGGPDGQPFCQSSSPTMLASPKKIAVSRNRQGAGTDEEDNTEDAADDADDNADVEATLAAAMASGQLPSVGSAKHDEGLCKRCCFFPKGRCHNGYECEFCHLEHDKRKRKKKKKGAKREESESGAEAGAAESAEGDAAQSVSVAEQAPPSKPPRGPLPVPNEPPPPAPAALQDVPPSSVSNVWEDRPRSIWEQNYYAGAAFDVSVAAGVLQPPGVASGYGAFHQYGRPAYSPTAAYPQPYHSPYPPPCYAPPGYPPPGTPQANGGAAMPAAAGVGRGGVALPPPR